MPSKSSGKTDLSTRPQRVAPSHGSTSRASSKSVSPVKPTPSNGKHSDLSSTSFDPASPLHFHGLADTQTQTQLVPGLEGTSKDGVGSENRATKKRKTAHNADARSAPEVLAESSNNKPVRPAPAKSASHSHSASKSATSKRRRSPSPVSSADSFIANEWQDPAKVFLASNRQFELPLSDLGRGSAREESPLTESPPTVAETSSVAVMRELTQVDLLQTPSSKQVTPRAKSDSKTKRQHGSLAPSQDSDMSPNASRSASPDSLPDIPDNASTPPVMSNPGSMDYVHTQTDEYEATQPLASDDLDAGITQVSDTGETGRTSPPPWNSVTSRQTTKPGNILAMVNPEKRWRYQQAQQPQPMLYDQSDGQTQPSSAVSKVPPISDGQKLFEQLKAQMHAAPQPAPPSAQPGSEEHDDSAMLHAEEHSRDTDIVPDSEPPEPSRKSSTPISPHPARSASPEDVPQPPQSTSPSPERVRSSHSTPRTKKPSAGKRPVVHSDNDDDDDEEDIPLVRTMARPAAKVAPRVPVKEAKTDPSPSRLGGQAAPMAKSKSGKTRVSSAAVKEIPSSVPEQDHRATRTPTPARAGSRQKGKAREVAMPPRAVATPEPKSTGSHPSMHDEDVIMQDTHPDNVTASYDEETTEPADDLTMEDAPQRSKASSSRKRPASPRKAVYKTAVRATSGTPSLASSARAAKRAKNHHTAATRVFALWKQDAAYFSGVVYERGSAADRFKIQFDDGDEDMVDVKNMRRLELHVDDRVSIVESQDKAVIVNADAQERGTVLVQLLDDDAASEFEVAVTAIKIQSRAVTSQWRDRVITAEELVPLLAPAAAVKTETPTSLRASGASLARKALAHVGVVVTFSAGCNREKEREDMVRIIKTSGGTCLDDWSDVWPLSGEYGAGRKRWVVGEQSVGTALQQEVQQVFLVSDAANSKPRYLTALALGIPCLSVDWLKALSSSKCIVADWPQYLLPAGYSDSLGARVTQLVDFDWGKTLDHLTDVMSNSVPTKLFAGQSVLVVGQEYFPPPAKGKKGSSGVGDEKSEGGRFVPRIILSMGAARVETVPDAKHASGKKFDYVIVKDLHERPADIAGTYVSMEWVKDCLIAGRLFPPP